MKPTVLPSCTFHRRITADRAPAYSSLRPHPERTVLYRALAHHFEHFVRGYEERFLATHGYLRGCVEPVVHRYLDCGIYDRKLLGELAACAWRALKLYSEAYFDGRPR